MLVNSSERVGIDSIIDNRLNVRGMESLHLLYCWQCWQHIGCVGESVVTMLWTVVVRKRVYDKEEYCISRGVKFKGVAFIGNTERKRNKRTWKHPKRLKRTSLKTFFEGFHGLRGCTIEQKVRMGILRRGKTILHYVWSFLLNPMRTSCRLVKRNILWFIEPIREKVRKKIVSYASFWCYILKALS